MEAELKVQALIQSAEMELFRDDYESARTLLEVALGKTVAEQVRVSELLIMVRERDLERRYGEARVLEIESDLEAALEIYKSIAAEWDDFKDVRTLISDIETTIEADTRITDRSHRPRRGTRTRLVRAQVTSPSTAVHTNDLPAK